MLKFLFNFILFFICGCDFREKPNLIEGIAINLIDSGVDTYLLKLSGVNYNFQLSLNKDAGQMPVYFEKFKSNICGIGRFIVVVSADAGGPITSGKLFYYLIIDIETKSLLNEIVAGEVFDKESGALISSERVAVEVKLRSGDFCFK